MHVAIDIKMARNLNPNCEDYARKVLASCSKFFHITQLIIYAHNAHPCYTLLNFVLTQKWYSFCMTQLTDLITTVIH